MSNNVLSTDSRCEQCDIVHVTHRLLGASEQHECVLERYILRNLATTRSAYDRIYPYLLLAVHRHKHYDTPQSHFAEPMRPELLHTQKHGSRWVLRLSILLGQKQ